MFRATPCSSSEESIVSVQPLVYVTLCRWPFRVQVSVLHIGKELPVYATLISKKSADLICHWVLQVALSVGPRWKPHPESWYKVSEKYYAGRKSWGNCWKVEIWIFLQGNSLLHQGEALSSRDKFELPSKISHSSVNDIGATVCFSWTTYWIYSSYSHKMSGFLRKKC